MDRRISVDPFKKGDFLRRSNRHNDQKSHYDHYLDTDRLLNETKRFVNELRDGNDKMLASKKRSDLEARVCDIAVADMTFIFAERIIYKFDQNRTNQRRQVTRADNDMSQIDLLKCTAFLAYQTFYWLHRNFNAQKKDTLIYFLANKGLRLPPHLELELHVDMLALRRTAQRDPWTYISETRKRNPLTDGKTSSKTTERKLPVPPVILLNETKPPENIAENHLNEKGAGRNSLDVTMGGKEPTTEIPGPEKSLKAKADSLKNTISLEKYLIDEAKALEDPPKSKEKRKRIIMGVKHLKAMTGSGMGKQSSVTTEHLAPEDPPKSKGKRKGIVMGVKHLKIMVESEAQKESAETNAHPSKEAGEMDKEENSSLETDDVANEELPNERMTEKKKEMQSKADDDEANKNTTKVETVRKDRETKSLKRDDELDETDALENPPKTEENRKRVIMGVQHLKVIMESRMGKETSTENEHVSKEALKKDEKEQKSLETDDVTLENPSLPKEKRQTIIMGVKQLEEMMHIGRRMEEESSEANENDEQTGSNESAKENCTTSTDLKKEKLPRERPHIQTKVKFRWRKKNKNKDENIPKEKKTKKHPIRSAIRNFCLSVFNRLVAAFR